jgi:hypothetical protein
MRFAVWSLAIATTCFGRLSLLRQTAGSGPLAWMCAYSTTRPFKLEVSSSRVLVRTCPLAVQPDAVACCTLHYAASGVFFALGARAVESWHFYIRFFRHAWLYQIGIATYIALADSRRPARSPSPRWQWTPSARAVSLRVRPPGGLCPKCQVCTQARSGLSSSPASGSYFDHHAAVAVISLRVQTRSSS